MSLCLDKVHVGDSYLLIERILGSRLASATCCCYMAGSDTDKLIETLTK